MNKSDDPFLAFDINEFGSHPFAYAAYSHGTTHNVYFAFSKLQLRGIVQEVKDHLEPSENRKCQSLIDCSRLPMFGPMDHVLIDGSSGFWLSRALRLFNAARELKLPTTVEQFDFLHRNFDAIYTLQMEPDNVELFGPLEPGVGNLLITYSHRSRAEVFLVHSHEQLDFLLDNMDELDAETLKGLKCKTADAIMPFISRTKPIYLKGPIAKLIYESVLYAAAVTAFQKLDLMCFNGS